LKLVRELATRIENEEEVTEVKVVGKRDLKSQRANELRRRWGA